MTPEMAKDFVVAMSAINGAYRSGFNGHLRTSYSTLEDVIVAVKPVLAKHNLCFIQRIHEGESARVETVFIHVTGAMLSTGICDVPVSKKDPQAYGSAITYSKKYSLLSACGIPSIDDDAEEAMPKEYRYKFPSDMQLSEAQLTLLNSIARYDTASKTWLASQPDPRLTKYLVGDALTERIKGK